jgi:hypothetical protein
MIKAVDDRAAEKVGSRLWRLPLIYAFFRARKRATSALWEKWLDRPVLVGMMTIANTDGVSRLYRVGQEAPLEIVLVNADADTASSLGSIV